MTLVWLLVFGTGILKKEVSLMKKDHYQEYKNTSMILLPRIFKSQKKTYAVYGAALVLIFTFYQAGGFLNMFGIRTPRKVYELF